MSVLLKCPSCGVEVQAPETGVVHLMRCIKCGIPYRILSPAATLPAPPAPAPPAPAAPPTPPTVSLPPTPRPPTSPVVALPPTPLVANGPARPAAAPAWQPPSPPAAAEPATESGLSRGGLAALCLGIVVVVLALLLRQQAEAMLGVLAGAEVGLLIAVAALAALVARRASGAGLPAAAVVLNLAALVVAGYFAFAGTRPEPPEEKGGGGPPREEPKQIVDLRKALADKDEQVRVKTIRGLGTDAETVNVLLPDLVENLKERDEAVLVATLEALKKIGPAARPAYPALLAAKHSPSRAVQEAAAAALDSIGTPTRADVPLLVQALRNSGMGANSSYRAYAAQCLAVLGSEGAAADGELDRCLSDPDRGVRIYAAQALWRIAGRRHHQQIVRKLIEGIENPEDAELRAAAARVLEQMATETALMLDELRRDKEREKENQKEIQQFTQIKDEVTRAMPALDSGLADSDLRVSFPAARACVAINRNHAPERVVPVLVRGLEDKEADTRGEAALTLAAIARQPKRPKETTAALQRAVPTLARLLSDKEERHAGVRARAAYALGAFGTEAREATAPLRQALQDPDLNVRKQVVFALGAVAPWYAARKEVDPEAKDAVDALRDALLDPNNNNVLRAQIAFALRAFGSQARRTSVVKDLRDRLHSEQDPGVKLFVAEALIIIDPSDSGPEVIPVLSQLLRNKEFPSLAQRASVALSALGRAAVPELMAALKLPDVEARILAAQALEKIGPPAKVAYPALDQLRNLEKIEEIKLAAGKAADAVGRLTEKDVPMLVEELKGPKDARYRVDVAYALSTLGTDGKGAVPALTETLKTDTHPEVRAQAAFALGTIGEHARPAAPALIAALKDADARVRSSAAFALASLGPTEETKPALKRLGELLADADANVRLNAAQAILSIDPEQTRKVAEELGRLTGTNNADTASTAAQILAQMGDKGRPAVDDLIKTYKNPDTDAKVREAVGEALKKIDKTAAQKAGVP